MGRMGSDIWEEWVRVRAKKHLSHANTVVSIPALPPLNPNTVTQYPPPSPT